MASKKASSPSPVSCWIARRQRRRGQRPCGDDHAVPLGRRQSRHLAALDCDQRMALEVPRHVAREQVAVDGQRPARRQLVTIARRHDQRAARAASPRAAARPRWSRHRPSGTSWSTPAPPTHPSCAPPSAATGRISCSTTGTPASATCQAASDPASPPPTIWMGVWGMRATWARRRIRAIGAVGPDSPALRNERLAWEPQVSSPLCSRCRLWLASIRRNETCLPFSRDRADSSANRSQAYDRAANGGRRVYTGL